MGKTTSLRRIIQKKLDGIIKSYYCTADKDAMFPHSVFDFENIDLLDINRDDLILTIDLWGKGKDTSEIENIADQIEEMFNAANMPEEDILPTFYRMNRTPIDDEDKSLIHRRLKFQIQNYYLGG